MMKHVGICTQDGPEEKSGEIRLQLSAWLGRLNAKLSVAGSTSAHAFLPLYEVLPLREQYPCATPHAFPRYAVPYGTQVS